MYYIWTHKEKATICSWEVKSLGNKCPVNQSPNNTQLIGCLDNRQREANLNCIALNIQTQIMSQSIVKQNKTSNNKSRTWKPLWLIIRIVPSEKINSHRNSRNQVFTILITKDFWVISLFWCVCATSNPLLRVPFINLSFDKQQI